MILYLDTSFLVKLYVQEPGSNTVRGAVQSASAVATCRIAYAEARSAFARKRREGGFTSAEYEQVRDDFERDWDKYLIIEVSEEIVRLAGELVDKHPLRGFDAIHLAAALTLKKKMRTPLIFGCADTVLERAARVERLKTSLERMGTGRRS
ncbi:MAG TPA: type II toxin-antitoxin system VapC family toxin [bacterium]|nr:type II toxin-antitoxin system VapC family toxin [bacterium]